MTSQTPTRKISCTGGATGYLASFISEAIDNYNEDFINLQYWPTTRNHKHDFECNGVNSPLTFRYQSSEEISQAAMTLLKIKPDVIVHAAAETQGL